MVLIITQASDYSDPQPCRRSLEYADSIPWRRVGPQQKEGP